MSAMRVEKQKSAATTTFTRANVQTSSYANDTTAIWLKSCDSPARFYLDRLEGKNLEHRIELAPARGGHTGSRSRLRRLQKPRGLRSGFTDCIRWLLSWRLFGPIFAF